MPILELGALDVHHAAVLLDGHVVHGDPSAQRLEDNGQVPLAVHDGRLDMVVGPTELISQEGAILEVVVGLDLAVLEVVGDEQHAQLVILELLAGDEVEGSGAGLAADAVVDDTRTLALFSHGLVHAVVGIQDAQDIGRHAHAEVAVGDVVIVLHLHGALVQEGNELTLDPLKVAVGEVAGSSEGEASLEHMTLVQALHQPLILHAGADHSDVLSHRSDDISVGEMLNAVGDISPSFLGQAHLDVRTSRHDELLEVVAEAGVNGMGVLSVRNGGIEVHLGHAVISPQVLQNGAIEIDLGGYIGIYDGAVGLLNLEHAGQGVGLGIEVGNSALGHADLVLGDHFPIHGGVDLGDTDVAVDLEEVVLTLEQRQVLAGIAGNQTINQGLHLDLGTIHEGNGSIGSQGIDQVFLLVAAGRLDNGSDLFDLDHLLVDRPGIKQTMQNGLIGSPHGGGDGSGQGNQVGHSRRLGQHVLHLGDVVLEDLGNTVRVFLQHTLSLGGQNRTVMLQHHIADLVGHVGNLHAGDAPASYAFIADGVGTFLQLGNNITNVAALTLTAKQNAHYYTAPFINKNLLMN